MKIEDKAHSYQNRERPILNWEDKAERLRTLGFVVGPKVLDYPAGFQKEKFEALTDLVAEAIMDWADVDLDEYTWKEVWEEFREFVDQHLVPSRRAI